MRDLLERSDLDRYAGQFVWLELNFDAPVNHDFFTKFGANATPTFFVIDPRDQKVTAMQPGAMSLEEVKQFLERGEAGFTTHRLSSADAALRRADTLRATRPAEAVKAYQEALRLAPAGWQGRELAAASLVGALRNSSQNQQCAETAVAEASAMPRDTVFARIVFEGLWCVVPSPETPWAVAATEKLRPLAEEALSQASTVRDHRDEIYRALMLIAVAHHDDATAAKFGDRWLAELDAITPATDDERSALDIARVENIQVYGDPARILPALFESERAMPANYIASLRLAQAEIMAKRYDDALAAIDRGLARSPGAMGTSWLWQMKAEVLEAQGKTADSRHALQAALLAAQGIPHNESRRNNIQRISKNLAANRER